MYFLTRVGARWPSSARFSKKKLRPFRPFFEEKIAVIRPFFEEKIEYNPIVLTI